MWKYEKQACHRVSGVECLNVNLDDEVKTIQPLLTFSKLVAKKPPHLCMFPRYGKRDLLRPEVGAKMILERPLHSFAKEDL